MSGYEGTKKKKRIGVQRNYKDNLFRIYVAPENDTDRILSHVNAVCGTSYSSGTEVKITTMDDAIFVESKNDLSVILDSRMYLFEQQSTVNNNMALRGFFYFSHLYEKYIEQEGNRLYREKRITIPAPRYYVLYNERKDIPAKQTLRLSDSLMAHAEGFEWTAEVINIGNGKNDDILGRCSALKDYMVFVDKVRELMDSGAEPAEAITEAVEHCINNGIMVDYLKSHRAETVEMILAEFNQEAY